MGRAFMAAGSRSVVTSLWAVDSEATEKLMVLFYEKLRSGAAAADALAQAKAVLRAGTHDGQYDDRGLVLDSSRRTPSHPPPHQSMVHPYFWSAFVFIGRAER
jgi:CHAT domain-containing protein